MAAVQLFRRTILKNHNFKKAGNVLLNFPSKIVSNNVGAASQLSFERFYRGSNRSKRLKEAREKKKLERDLENKYGIKSKPEFNFKTWMKENYMKEVDAFQSRIGIQFNDTKMLIGAFAHNSFRDEIGALVSLSNSEDTATADISARLQIIRHLPDVTYDRLSLLGYEVATSIIKEELYNKYKNLTPSICQDVCLFLTSREVISSLAKNIGLEDFLLLSRELDNLNEEAEESVYVNTMEDLSIDTFFALLGAIEKDLGQTETISFIKDFILPHLDHTDLTKYVEMEDPHGELMKIFSLQGISTTVRARTIVETGVDSHFPVFQVGIFCRGKQIGEGTGHSTSIARENAFKSTVFQCLENEVDFTRLRKSSSK
ncbi:ribonuclease 3-like [Clytia hemisphaerica]|uniref:ribonuclease 3-like n=1 Tax=Clytia hemisphaerica TaxID=252671 RepID=UPI0034D74B66